MGLGIIALEHIYAPRPVFGPHACDSGSGGTGTKAIAPVSPLVAPDPIQITTGSLDIGALQSSRAESPTGEDELEVVSPEVVPASASVNSLSSAQQLARSRLQIATRTNEDFLDAINSKQAGLSENLSGRLLEGAQQYFLGQFVDDNIGAYADAIKTIANGSRDKLLVLVGTYDQVITQFRNDRTFEGRNGKETEALNIGREAVADVLEVLAGGLRSTIRLIDQPEGPPIPPPTVFLPPTDDPRLAPIIRSETASIAESSAPEVDVSI